MNDNSNAIESAQAWAKEIVEWFESAKVWLNARPKDLIALEYDDAMDPEDTKPEPLSVLVRNDWKVPGTANEKPIEYEILLATGGPAVRLIGSLDEHGEAETVTLQCQDWFTPWTGVACDDDTTEALGAYVATFYFGE